MPRNRPETTARPRPTFTSSISGAFKPTGHARQVIPALTKRAKLGRLPTRSAAVRSPNPCNVAARMVALIVDESTFGGRLDRPAQSPLYGGSQTFTVTWRNVAGMEVASALGLVFWVVNRSASSLCRSPVRPLASAAAKAFMVGP